MKKTIEVVAAAIVKNKKVLITKRLKGEFAGLWEFPGGKIESGETHAQTIVREIHEELEIDIEPIRELITVSYDYPTFHLVMHVYLCHYLQGRLHLNDHSDYQFIGKNDHQSINWVPADVQVINYLIQSEL